MKIGSAIKHIRLQSGYKQGELSKSLGISQKHLSLIESDKVDLSFRLLRRIAKELDVAEEVIFWKAIKMSNIIVDKHHFNEKYLA